MYLLQVDEFVNFICNVIVAKNPAYTTSERKMVPDNQFASRHVPQLLIATAKQNGITLHFQPCSVHYTV